ncbi:MAG TPA: carboxypeptidase regulatory-like domain-containing protein [Bryobacteraceae bacterium]|nr:carboxypeptidase regulatory-like domain-containing protein [Bryobacteraceae bacterium]
MQFLHRFRKLVLFLAGSALLYAQTGTSSITGTVTDATSSAIPNAGIVLVNEESGARFVTRTNEAGNYRLASLLPARYRIEATAAGFEKASRGGLVLAVSQVLPVDLTLQVGQASETVTVTETVPVAETQSSSVGQLVNRKMVSGLPMPNRAATSLVALAPGVVMIDTGQGAENYPVFSVAGGRARNQNFTLDGGNVTNAVGLTRPQQMTSLPMDAMQEFRVIGNAYSAEYGHSTGGIITLSTRSGTNQLHGSVFEFLRNSALDARNFFAAERAPIRMHQFGGSLGGPIRKDKTHFFATWEQTRQLTSTIDLQTVPDLAQRAGDFFGLRDGAGRVIPIYDPSTTVGRERQPFPENRIPLDRFDPVALAALSYWPSPNRTPGPAGGSNYAANADSDLHRNIFVAKVDHQLRSNDQLTVRYYLNDSFIGNRGSFPRREAAPDANVNDVRIQSVLAGHTHTFSPNLISELKVSFFQRRFIDERYGFGENLAGAIGLTGVSAAAFPTFTIPGYASLGGQVGRHQTPIRDTQILEAVSWFRGRHALKFGVEHRRGRNTEVRDRSSAGLFGITPLITGKPGTSGAGDAFASFLLGEVNSASVNVSDQITSRAYYLAGYVQDDWRATDHLTLNFGLRWESELPRRVDEDRQNSFDLSAINPVSGTPGIVTFSGRDGVPRQAFNTDWNNFGPRVGFAYRLPFQSETVIRAAAGVFYGSTVSNTIGDTASTGFSTAASLVVPQADLLSAMQLRNGFPAFERPPLDARFGAVPLGRRPYTAVGFFERNRPTPVSYQYNANIQRVVASETVVEAGYIANVSHHLTANDLSLNQVAPELMGPGDAQARRPFPQFSNVYIINPAIGNSTYHAGYIRAEKRFARGLSFLAHYTFSKFLDDVVSSNEYGDPQSYMDAYNRRLDKSLSGTDVPHRTVLSILYEVPRIRSNRYLNIVGGGWKLGGFGTWQSGAPFTVTTLANTTNAFSAGPLRPDLIGAAELPGAQRSLERWFNTDAFRNPAQFRFGNAPRSVLRGPFQQSVDLTVAKEFEVTERYRVDLRGEFYNAFNHANFDLPGHTLGAADFGTILSARPPRTVQLGLRLSF